jgi:hypothetical protein
LEKLSAEEKTPPSFGKEFLCFYSERMLVLPGAATETLRFPFGLGERVLDLAVLGALEGVGSRVRGGAHQCQAAFLQDAPGCGTGGKVIEETSLGAGAAYLPDASTGRMLGALRRRGPSSTADAPPTVPVSEI